LARREMGRRLGNRKSFLGESTGEAGAKNRTNDRTAGGREV